MTYKPDGYPDVSAYLLVGDIDAEAAFVERALGGTRLRMIRDDSGTLIHGEVRLGDSVVMMGRAPGAAGGHVHVYLPDADEAFDRALDAGGTTVQPMTEKGDGDRRGGVASPGGTVWWLALQLAAEA